MNMQSLHCPHLMVTTLQGWIDMSREDFFNWLNSCPSDEWLQIGDDVGSIKIKFFIDEDEEKEDDD